IYESLLKKQTSTERSKIRKALKESGSPQQVLAGIANEESIDEMSDKAKIEAAAEIEVEKLIPELRKQAAELAEQVEVALKAVGDANAEEQGALAALESETDPVLSKEEWPEIEKLNY